MDTIDKLNQSLLERLPPDHYQRYLLTSLAVSQIEQILDLGKLTILDVGGHSSSLKLFLPENKVVLSDPLDPPAFTHRKEIPFQHSGYVVGLGGQLPFRDESFELVAAHDTLEHVPPESREAFLEDMMRVSSRFLILNGPVANNEVVRAEKRISDFWDRTLHWKEHFLSEHAQHTLPSSELIQAKLSEAGSVFVAIPNGDFHRWFLLMAIRSYLLALAESDSLQVAIDVAYNRLISPMDFGTRTYREAYLVSNRSEDRQILDDVAKVIQAQEIDKGASQVIEDLVDALETHANQISQHTQKLHDQIEFFSYQADQLSEQARVASQNSESYRSQLETNIQELAQVRRAFQEARKRLNEIALSPEFHAFERIYRGLVRVLPFDTVRGRTVRRAMRGAKRVISAPNHRVVRHADLYTQWIESEEPKQWVPLDIDLSYRPTFLIEVFLSPDDSQASIDRTLDSLAKQHYLPEAVKVHSRGISQNLIEKLSGRPTDLYGPDDDVPRDTADYACFIQAGDVLNEHALLELAALLNKDPALDYAYSDYDHIGSDGLRARPRFTPQWSPELLISEPYAAAFFAVRLSILDSIGPPNTKLGSATLWDLALRATEQARKVARISKVLVHKSARRNNRNVQIALIQSHLARQNLNGEVIHDGNIRVKWNIKDSPIVSVIIPTAHNRVMLRRCLGSLQSAFELQRIIVDSTERTPDKEKWYAELVEDFDFQLLWWQDEFNYSRVNNFAAQHATGDILLFLNDDIEMINRDAIDEMVGWTEREGVGLVGAQLLYENGDIQHAGVIVGLGDFADHVFRGLRPEENTIFGSPNSYRNFLAVTGAAMMIERQLFERLGGWDERFLLCGSDVELGLRARRGGYRSMVTPHARFRHYESATRGTRVPVQDFFTSFWDYQPFLYGGDPYFNPNLSGRSPAPTLKLEHEIQPSEAVSSIIGRSLAPFRQQHGGEAEAFSELCQVEDGEVDKTHDLHSRNSSRTSVSTINWFIPDVDSPFYGGIHTIFRFANHFKDKYDVKNRFVVIGNGPEQYVHSGLRAAFPRLAESEIIVGNFLVNPSALDDLPKCDAAIATLWFTAYAVSKFAGAKRKFYFIQDFEPMFYPAGTMYGLAEESYRLGLYGICNSLPLKDIYESQYGGKAAGFVPCVDTSFFYPDDARRNGPPYTVFLYGRPGHWRNCYELAVAALKRLKQDLKHDVRIVTAGSWAINESIGDGFMNSLGLLDYRDTPALYRSCDAGLVLTVSRHPSYLPLELMASGALVIQNENPTAMWLLRDGDTCLLATPTADDLYRKLKVGLLETNLREKIVAAALENIRAKHSDWASAMDGMYHFMERPNNEK